MTGAELRAYRDKHGLTQVGLARALGKEGSYHYLQMYIARLENGRNGRVKRLGVPAWIETKLREMRNVSK